MTLVVMTLPGCSKQSAGPNVDELDNPATEDSAQVLVAVHSYTGRTIVAGLAIAAMLDARFVRYGSPPQGLPALPGASAKKHPQLAPADVTSADTVFLGFPIWSDGPSPDAMRIAALPEFAGKRVVPFFTYVHYVQPETLSALSVVLEKSGATALPPVGIRIPMFDTEEQVVASVEQAILARPDLWGGDQSTPDRVCHEPSGNEDRTCRVPAGHAWVGDTRIQDAPRGYIRPRLVHVPAFDIDRAEATVADLRQCTEAGACPPLKLQGFCVTLVQEGGEGVPAPCVSYGQAVAYCRWRGMTLPTQAQWARAARGATTWAYPWPGDFRRDGGNLGEHPPFGYPDYSIPTAQADWPFDGYRGLAPPCHFEHGLSAFGLCDMAGNVAEWLDQQASDSSWAPLTGGSWLSVDPSDVRVGSLAYHPKDFAFYLTGVRCARPASISTTTPDSDD